MRRKCLTPPHVSPNIVDFLVARSPLAPIENNLASFLKQTLQRSYEVSEYQTKNTVKCHYRSHRWFSYRLFPTLILYAWTNHNCQSALQWHQEVVPIGSNWRREGGVFKWFPEIIWKHPLQCAVQSNSNFCFLHCLSSIVLFLLNLLVSV